MKMVLPALNVQFPISHLIVSGKKSVETREYDLPKHYVNQELIVVETPGLKEKFRARAIGTVIFAKGFKYKSKSDFYSDSDRHRVQMNSPWAWRNKFKWGWPIQSFQKFERAVEVIGKRGIVFTKSLEISF